MKNHPYINQLKNTLLANYRFAAGIVDRGATLFGNKWKDEFESVLSALFPTEDTITAAAKGYATFSMSSMRLQAAFEKELQYKYKTYEQAAQEVYFNEDHMMREYLPGLLVSHYLWPHHYRQLQFFDVAFVQPMRLAEGSSFIEVGVGTGLYSSLVLRNLQGATGVGFDISPSSKKFTEAQMDAFGIGDRYHVELCDITTSSNKKKTDWLVCVEVLEHLEDPISFLRALRLKLTEGGKAFITAAMNAAHDDHIYLYRGADEVLSHLQEAGFALEQSFVGAAYKPSRKGTPVPAAAAFVVF